MAEQQRSPILEVFDRYCKALSAGSANARGQLREFVLGVIDTYDGSWQLLLGNATTRYVSGHPQLFATPAELVRFTRRLRYEKFRARMPGAASLVDLRHTLRECLDRFGDEYLATLARRIAEAMAAIPRP